MARDPQIPPEDTEPQPTGERPVFDRGEDEPPLQDSNPLHIDDEGNVLPGNDPLDEDPNDNGDLEQFDPEDKRHLREIGDLEADL